MTQNRHRSVPPVGRNNQNPEQIPERQQRIKEKKSGVSARFLKRVRWHHALLSVCCLIVMAVMIAANFLSPDKEFSEEENRVLAGKPEMTFSSLTSGKYMKDYESYVADQFPWRNG